MRDRLKAIIQAGQSSFTGKAEPTPGGETDGEDGFDPEAGVRWVTTVLLECHEPHLSGLRVVLHDVF